MTREYRKHTTEIEAKVRTPHRASFRTARRHGPSTAYRGSFTRHTGVALGLLDADTFAALQRMLADASRVACGRRSPALMRELHDALLGAFLGGGEREWARVYRALAAIEAGSDAVLTASHGRIRAFLDENPDLAGSAAVLRSPRPASR